MARLIYAAIASLDGYVADADGNFDWAEPDEEVFGFVNELERPVGTYLFGRRMYEVMVYWETADTLPDEPAVVREFTKLWLVSRQDRLLDHARRGLHRQDDDREVVRPGSSPAPEERRSPGSHRRRPASRRGGVSSRPRR